MSIEIKPADLPSKLREIEQLAQSIWREHYTPIIGHDQVEYMLEKFQSMAAMSQQIDEGYQYYGVYESDELIGYFSFQPRLPLVFLSKFYLERNTRGKGYARKILEYICQQCIKLNASAIELTVNKYNTTSIAVYSHLGFVTKREAVFDIGDGYVMDDYVMERRI